MKAEVPKGKYILAVSGGVDSMVLLDLLSKKSNLELVVAHFNHNIRKDSVMDQKLVKAAASRYKLAFEFGSGNLGSSASEQVARDARYAFLRKLQAKHRAKAIITAHHQDDVIETAFINVIRGTNRRGLSAIVNNKEVIRPLRKIAKTELVKYAKINKLTWREDITNQDTDYLRNYLRLSVLTKLTRVQKQKLTTNLERVAKLNNQIDNKLATLSHLIDKDDINRHSFSSLPDELGNELVAYYLRQSKVSDYDSETVKRLSMAIKTSRPNTTHAVKQMTTLKVGKSSAKLLTP